MKRLLALCLIGMLAPYAPLISYDLPIALNLGTTNILDGGPKLESPGFYWVQHQLNYHAHKFLDENGKPLGIVKSPSLNIFALLSEFTYQSKINFLGGSPAFSLLSIPLVASTNSRNSIGISTVNIGVGNPILIPFFQFKMITYKSRPLFIHKIGTYIGLPYGTNKYPTKTINPADILYFFDSFWSASLYIKENLVASWRLFYLWCAKNKKTKVTPGQTFHMNYSLEYEVHKDFWIAINGYYLQQLQDNKKCHKTVPNSKERVFSIGPGFYAFLPRNFQLLGHLYFESKVKNRPQGITAYLNFIKHF